MFYIWFFVFAFLISFPFTVAMVPDPSQNSKSTRKALSMLILQVIELLSSIYPVGRNFMAQKHSPWFLIKICSSDIYSVFLSHRLMEWKYSQM